MKPLRQHLLRAGVFAVALLILMVLTVATARAVVWDAGPLNLSLSASIRENTDLAVNGDEVSVIWAGNATAPGLTLARSSGSGWSKTPIAVPAGTAAWYPHATYGDDTLMISWVQGEAQLPGTLPRTIMQRNAITGSPQTVMSNIYGFAAPVMADGDTGIHMTFAAATTNTAWANADLYYAYRPYGQTAWPNPTRLVDHDKVIVTGASGGILYPRVAIDPVTDRIHIVWEQKQKQAYIYVDYSVWHISGRRQGGSVIWSSPTRISPPDQEYAVRPNVVVGPDSSVHIVWTQLDVGSGSTLQPEAQHIYYRRLDDAEPKRLNPEPLEVNNILPTWATSSITAEGDNVCVAWHGFSTNLNTTIEEITTRCSSNKGVTWQTVSNTSESASWLSIFPVVGLNDEGDLHTAWTEFELQDATFVPHAIYYRTGSVHSASNANGVYLPFVVNNKR